MLIWPSWVTRQVDLALEARHLWQFNFNFRKRQGVRFPFPIYPLVEAEVLVETFEAGSSISNYIAAPGNRFNSRRACCCPLFNTAWVSVWCIGQCRCSECLVHRPMPM